MAYQNDGDEIKCEYVYEDDKKLPKPETSIFAGEYDEGNSDEEEKAGQDKPNPNTEERSRPSKMKRRVSRYDENLYALPDSDEESEMIAVKAR